MNTIQSQAAANLRGIFEREISVRHIAEFDLEFADAADDGEKVEKQMAEEDFDVMPVRADGEVVGYVVRAELRGGSCLEQVRQITVDDLVSDSTPLMVVLELLGRRQWLFVLQENKVVGIVTVADVRKPPVQMYLFGLLIILELKLTRLIKHYWRQEGEWSSFLSPKRLSAANERLVDRQRRNEGLRLIDCLTMADKREIIEETPAVLEGLSMSKAQFRKLLKLAEDVRNQLAHAQDFLEGVSWAEILELNREIHRILDLFDGRILIDFSSVPSDSALVIAQNRMTEELASSLAHSLGLDHIDRDLLEQELVGVIAGTIDRYLSTAEE